VRTITLAIMAVLLLFTGIAVSGIICLVACILSATSAKGIDIDIHARDYRLFTSLAGYKIGDWERIPEAQGIVMKYYSDFVTSSRSRRAPTNQGSRYIVMFSVLESSQGVIVHQTAKYEAAKHLTESLAQALGVEAKIYDKA
jgi:hypothetical protein